MTSLFAKALIAHEQILTNKSHKIRLNLKIPSNKFLFNNSAFRILQSGVYYIVLDYPARAHVQSENLPCGATLIFDIVQNLNGVITSLRNVNNTILYDNPYTHGQGNNTFVLPTYLLKDSLIYVEGFVYNPVDLTENRVKINNLSLSIIYVLASDTTTDPSSPTIIAKATSETPSLFPPIPQPVNDMMESFNFGNLVFDQPNGSYIINTPGYYKTTIVFGTDAVYDQFPLASDAQAAYIISKTNLSGNEIPLIEATNINIIDSNPIFQTNSAGSLVVIDSYLQNEKSGLLFSVLLALAIRFGLAAVSFLIARFKGITVEYLGNQIIQKAILSREIIVSEKCQRISDLRLTIQQGNISFENGYFILKENKGYEFIIEYPYTINLIKDHVSKPEPKHESKFESKFEQKRGLQYDTKCQSRCDSDKHKETLFEIYLLKSSSEHKNESKEIIYTNASEVYPNSRIDPVGSNTLVFPIEGRVNDKYSLHARLIDADGHIAIIKDNISLTIHSL